MPKVSVIVPNFNHSEYLEQRINCILNQTYQNFELIILDDNSTDNSKVVIEKFRNHPKLSHIIYNNVNSGSPFIQWDKGIKLSQGEYIWIAESDDYCEKEFLQLAVNQLVSAKENVLVYCNSQLVDEDGKYISPILNNKLKVVKPNSFIGVYMCFTNSISNASSAVFRKDILNHISDDYMQYRAAGDKMFWIQLSEHGNVVFIDSPLNYFRQHLNKVSPKKMRNGTTLREEFLIYKYLCDVGHINSFIKKFLVKNHFCYYAYNIDFESSRIQQELLHIWKNDFLNSKRIVSIIYRLNNLLYRLIRYKDRLFHSQDLKYSK